MGSGRRRSLLPSLLPPLLLLLPAAWGDCGPLPNISHGEPPEDIKHLESFRVGFTVQYSCLRGYVKRPLLSDTIQCLANSQWSNLPEFCGRSCPSPPRVRFAKLSQKDEMQNFYAVGVTVKYLCHPGYENTTEQLPTSTCLDNLKWSEVPKLCRRKSCGIPANPEHGKVIANNHLLGERADVVCNHGYTLKGASPVILCSLRGSEVAWSQLPTCWAISCPPPPAIADGKHNGNGTEEFVYNSVVMYTCDPGLQLVGNETLRCTTENRVYGVWSGSPPQCRVSTTAVTNQTDPSEERIAENLYWLASIIVPTCIAASIVIGILAGIIMKWKVNKNDSYNIRLRKHEMKGRDPMMDPKMTDGEKHPTLWHSYFCHTTSCHVCPTCKEQLHAATGAHKPTSRSCATCQDWLSAQLGTLRTYSVLSIGVEESQNPTGTSSPAKADDVLRGDGAGEAVSEQSKAKQPVDHKSNNHICPICENWLRTHLGQSKSHPAAPEEHPVVPHRQDERLQGPVCPACASQLHLSLVHSDTACYPVCPLAAEGTPAHLVPHRTPSCHVCPVCATPTHTHLCQAPDG